MAPKSKVGNFALRKLSRKPAKPACLPASPIFDKAAVIRRSQIPQSSPSPPEIVSSVGANNTTAQPPRSRSGRSTSTQHTRPGKDKQQSSQALSNPTGPLDPGWSALIATDGRTYYWNEATGCTTWVCPSTPRQPEYGLAPRPASAPHERAEDASRKPPAEPVATTAIANSFPLEPETVFPPAAAARRATSLPLERSTSFQRITAAEAFETGLTSSAFRDEARRQIALEDALRSEARLHTVVGSPSDEAAVAGVCSH